MTPPRATASCWSICWKPRDKKFSPDIFCPGKFYVIPKPVKKLEKLFIAPKVRQVLYETSQRVFTRCACAQRTGFLIKFFIKNQYQKYCRKVFLKCSMLFFCPRASLRVWGPSMRFIRSTIRDLFRHSARGGGISQKNTRRNLLRLRRVSVRISTDLRGRGGRVITCTDSAGGLSPACFVASNFQPQTATGRPAVHILIRHPL